MAKLWSDDEYDYRTGLTLISVPRGRISLIILKDENGVTHEFSQPTMLDVEKLCEELDLSVEVLMSQIASCSDDIHTLIIKLPEYRAYDTEKRHMDGGVALGFWFAERWMNGNVSHVWAGNSAREALEYVRNGIEHGVYHVEKLIGPDDTVYARGHKSWSDLCSQERIHT